MGMKTYPVKDYGLYVTEEDLCGYAERNNTETYCSWNLEITTVELIVNAFRL